MAKRGRLRIEMFDTIHIKMLLFGFQNNKNLLLKITCFLTTSHAPRLASFRTAMLLFYRFY